MSTIFLRSSSCISLLISVYPSRQPESASAVWRGLRQVVTFILSTLSTVCLSQKYTPASSRAGRPAGNLSSMTRYSASSALTKGAMYVCFAVTMGSLSSKPSFSSICLTLSSGRGVILSIMDIGKLTRFSSPMYSRKALSADPLSTYALAMVSMAALSLSPLCEQLSIETKAIGYAPFCHLRYIRYVRLHRKTDAWSMGLAKSAT